MSKIIGILWAVIIFAVTVPVVVWGAFVPYEKPEQQTGAPKPEERVTNEKNRRAGQ